MSSRRWVLVDSSVWVGHLTGQSSALSETLIELLKANGVAVNEVIRLEVLTGARDDAQYAELADALQGLHALPVSEAVWAKAGRLRYELRRKGHTIPVPDALIAVCAILYDCELLHVDRHFDIIGRAAPLKVHRKRR